MALIKCPECGKEISDTTKKCPNCGFAMKKKPNKKIIIIMFLIIVIIIIGGTIGYFLHQEKLKKERITAEEALKQEKENYEVTLIATAYGIKRLQGDCEWTGASIYSTWDDVKGLKSHVADLLTYYITGEGDMSDTMKREVDAPINEVVNAILEADETINENMLKLKKYPEGYEESYNLMKELYSEYQSFKTLCTEVPYNYNLLEYGNTFTEQDNALSKTFSELCVLYPQLSEMQ